MRSDLTKVRFVAVINNSHLQAEIANIKLEILQKQQAQSKRKKTKGQGRRHKVRHHHFYEWEKIQANVWQLRKAVQDDPNREMKADTRSGH